MTDSQLCDVCTVAALVALQLLGLSFIRWDARPRPWPWPPLLAPTVPWWCSVCRFHRLRTCGAEGDPSCIPSAVGGV